MLSDNAWSNRIQFEMRVSNSKWSMLSNVFIYNPQKRLRDFFFSIMAECNFYSQFKLENNVSIAEFNDREHMIFNIITKGGPFSF